MEWCFFSFHRSDALDADNVGGSIPSHTVHSVSPTYRGPLHELLY